MRARGLAWILAALASTACASASHQRQWAAAPPATLEEYIGKVRALSATAKPRTGNGSMAQSLETWDARLARALHDADVEPTAAHHRAVAAEYARLRVLDMAYAHLVRATVLDPKDGSAYEGLARIWRDWGFPALGLSDAYRAAALAPQSAAVANTVGTLLAAAGQTTAARDWYTRALTLDTHASYALNNLCYVEFLASRTDARRACEQAAVPGPYLRTARQNLALVYAASGDFEAARTTFAAAAATPADAEYNMGVVYMASGQFNKAADAFAAARKARPMFALAATRERQARAAATLKETAGAHQQP